ncbi:unnamed protein product [Meloidogyne enterolobii]|uniref:Uncharacterized protein n=1 Tax=Meloidogyne enterolobii TaxID=390850 RepID=A0ACB0ZFV0_MELEN
MTDIWLGDNIEIGLSLNSKNSNTTDCNRTLLLTEQGFAYEKIKNNPKRQKRSFSQEIDWDHESLITGSQLGGQLTYLDHEVKESLIFQFTHSLRQLCEFAEETRKWTTTALLSNPTTLARAILNNTNLIARHISGTTLKIWPCVQLTPTQYKISPTYLETCFDLLPITIKTHGKDELAFLDPANLLISPKARKAPCSQYRKIPIQINGTLMEIDQITGETTTLYTQTLTSKSFHEIDIPKLLPHAFHHLVLVNLTDIITHSYFSSLTEVSQITYRIEQQNSAVKPTMSTDWEEVRKEIVNEAIGDWSGIQNWFCLIICIIAAIDITIRISAILIENYLKNFTIIRALTTKTAIKQKTAKILETKSQPEATKRHQIPT